MSRSTLTTGSPGESRGMGSSISIGITRVSSLRRLLVTPATISAASTTLVRHVKSHTRDCSKPRQATRPGYKSHKPSKLCTPGVTFSQLHSEGKCCKPTQNRKLSTLSLCCILLFADLQQPLLRRLFSGERVFWRVCDTFPFGVAVENGGSLCICAAVCVEPNRLRSFHSPSPWAFGCD
jgi:hypothetical protein